MPSWPSPEGQKVPLENNTVMRSRAQGVIVFLFGRNSIFISNPKEYYRGPSWPAPRKENTITAPPAKEKYYHGPSQQPPRKRNTTMAPACRPREKKILPWPQPAGPRKNTCTSPGSLRWPNQGIESGSAPRAAFAFKNPYKTLPKPFKNLSKTLQKPFQNSSKTLRKPFQNPSK